MKIKLTDWFPVRIKPVRTGLYQVQTKSWPWPMLVEFEEGSWSVDRGEHVTQWRGLTLEQENPKKE